MKLSQRLLATLGHFSSVRVMYFALRIELLQLPHRRPHSIFCYYWDLAETEPPRQPTARTVQRNIQTCNKELESTSFDTHVVWQVHAAAGVFKRKTASFTRWNYCGNIYAAVVNGFIVVVRLKNEAKIDSVWYSVRKY